jgi:hypothetical protein
MGWLSIINSVTNISRLGTFKISRRERRVTLKGKQINIPCLRSSNLVKNMHLRQCLFNSLLVSWEKSIKSVCMSAPHLLCWPVCKSTGGTAQWNRNKISGNERHYSGTMWRGDVKKIRKEEQRKRRHYTSDHESAGILG